MTLTQRLHVYDGAKAFEILAADLDLNENDFSDHRGDN